MLQVTLVFSVDLCTQIVEINPVRSRDTELTIIQKWLPIEHRERKVDIHIWLRSHDT